MVEVSLTVGKLDASLALLLTKDHHLIEFPTILLPNGVRAGSIVKIKCDQDLEGEKEEQQKFQEIQDEILSTFGTNLPSAPNLKIKNVTQTSCVLEWDTLELGTASLKNLILFKDGKKLGAIPQPLTNNTTKLSGLSIDETFHFQLRLDTTAGVYLSAEIEVTTHKMTDLSGITICMGDISANEPFTTEDIENTLKNMGANYPPQDKIKVDTTHFICTRENKQNPEFLKASDMNIPIIRPEWLKACERERRIVGVRDFYVKDCVLPDILSKNYWQKGNTGGSASAVENEEATSEKEKSSGEQPKTDSALNESSAPKVANEESGDKEDKTIDEIKSDNIDPSTDIPVSSAEAPEIVNEKADEGDSNSKTNEDSEERQEGLSEGETQGVTASSSEPHAESETKTEVPVIEETKIAEPEPTVSSEIKEEKNELAETESVIPSEDKEEITTGVDAGVSKEAESTMEEVKLEEEEDEESKQQQEEVKDDSSNLVDKEESTEPDVTETEGEGDGEVLEKETKNTSTPAKKKKNNKKKNKKK